MNAEDKMDQMMELLNKLAPSLEKISKEQQAHTKRFNKLDVDMSGAKTELSKVKEDTAFTRTILARLDIEHGKKLDMLMDNAYTSIEKGRTNEAAIVSLTDKVEKLEIELNVLKNAK